MHISSVILAVDTVLMSNSQKTLQFLLNNVEKHAFTWRLFYNSSKSVFIVFNKTNVLFFIVKNNLEVILLNLTVPHMLAAFYNQIISDVQVTEKFFASKTLLQTAKKYESLICLLTTVV